MQRYDDFSPSTDYNSSPALAVDDQPQNTVEPPIIFLDMDGVVVTERSCINDKGTMGVPDPVAVEMINKLCEDFGAKIVVSSSWRNLFDRRAMYHILKGMGFRDEHLYGYGSMENINGFYTPSLKSACRGEEIARWLGAHPGVERYVILDDTPDMLSWQAPCSVITDGFDGMAYSDYRYARSILAAGRPERPSETIYGVP